MHPDIIRIVPDNHIIKIAAIRDLFRFTISKPNEAAMRVIIIENADTMNEQAQNAFLKMLEEPPVNTFFILIAENINSLLATIVSRCRNIWLNPVDIKNKEHIAEKADNDVEWVNRKNWIIKEIISIIDTEKQQNRFNRLKPLLFAEKLSREHDILKKSLGVISTFFRDLAVCHYNPDKINNTNYTQTLINISNKISLKKTLYFFSTLYEAERKNHFNPSSIRLNLECLFLKISSGEK
jgi:DNA polymerase-3 subunit delta'